jgi:hypothetical protein
MSSLWTPSGEHFPKKEGDDETPSGGQGPVGADPGGRDPGGAAPPRRGMAPGDFGHDAMSREEAEEAQKAVEEMREQLAHTPAEVVVANHCYGLFELAAIYLSQSPPMLFQARLAIDGLGAILDALQGRLGEAESSLRESLSQLRLVFVRLEGDERSGAQPSSDGGVKD